MKTLVHSSDLVLKKALLCLVYLFVLWATVYALVFCINTGIFLYDYLNLKSESYSLMFDGGYFFVNGELVGMGPNAVNWLFWGLLLVGIVFVIKRKQK